MKTPAPITRKEPAVPVPKEAPVPSKASTKRPVSATKKPVAKSVAAKVEPKEKPVRETKSTAK